MKLRVLPLLASSCVWLHACSETPSDPLAAESVLREQALALEASRQVAVLWSDLLSGSAGRQQQALLVLFTQPQLAVRPFDGIIVPSDDAGWVIDSNGVRVSGAGLEDDSLRTLVLGTIPSICTTSDAFEELDHAAKIRLLTLIDDLVCTRRRWVLQLAETDVDPTVAVFQTFGLVSLQDSMCGSLSIIRRTALEGLTALAADESERLLASERTHAQAADRTVDAELHRQSLQNWDAVGTGLKAGKLPGS